MREDQDPYGAGEDIYGAGGQRNYYGGNPTSSAPTAGVAPYNPGAAPAPAPAPGIVQNQTFDPNNPNRPVIHPGMSGTDILAATNSYQPGYAPGAPGTPAVQAPGYVNANDPVQAAVWQAFQKKGLAPRDQNDFQYWVDRINQSQGGWGDQGNKQYWLDRMGQSQGGVGDYQERPEAGASGGGAFNSASGLGLFDPQSLAKIKQSFLSRLDSLSKPVDANDPSVAGAIGANKLLSQRTLEDAKRGLAEQAYAKGTLNTAGYDQSQIQAGEREGGMEAAFAGNAVSQAQQQREQLLNQLLGQGGSITSGANNLQLGYDNLGYNYAGLQNSMNKDAMLAALGYYGG